MLAESKVRDRPIIFTGPMVRALLDGSKTQTRRVVKMDDSRGKPFIITSQPSISNGQLVWLDGTTRRAIDCPYGVVGERLWVREKFRTSRPFTGNMDHDYSSANLRVSYYADDNPRYRDQDKWKSPIHMPRWASRLILEITAVRVERLQEISNADCLAEGCKGDFRIGPGFDFMARWNTINANRGHSWESNPWVWAISFQPLKGTPDAG